MKRWIHASSNLSNWHGYDINTLLKELNNSTWSNTPEWVDQFEEDLQTDVRLCDAVAEKLPEIIGNHDMRSVIQYSVVGPMTTNENISTDALLNITTIRDICNAVPYNIIKCKNIDETILNRLIDVGHASYVLKLNNIPEKVVKKLLSHGILVPGQLIAFAFRHSEYLNAIIDELNYQYSGNIKDMLNRKMTPDQKKELKKLAKQFPNYASDINNLIRKYSKSTKSSSASQLTYDDLTAKEINRLKRYYDNNDGNWNNMVADMYDDYLEGRLNSLLQDSKFYNKYPSIFEEMCELYIEHEEGN